MTQEARRLGAVVIRVQNEFLEWPALALTAAEARDRFGVDGTTCNAVLETLVDAHVLARTPEGRYLRFFPRRGNGSGPNGSTDRVAA